MSPGREEGCVSDDLKTIGTKDKAATKPAATRTIVRQALDHVTFDVLAPAGPGPWRRHRHADISSIQAT